MPKTILIVEDTPDLMANLAQFLEMEDFGVIQCANGEEALKKLEGETPDLIITDLLMPNIDGFEFIRRVRADERWKTIPIIVFSAKPPRETEEQVFSLGANRYIKKPSSIDQILASVNDLIRA